MEYLTINSSNPVGTHLDTFRGNYEAQVHHLCNVELTLLDIQVRMRGFQLVGHVLDTDLLLLILVTERILSRYAVQKS